MFSQLHMLLPVRLEVSDPKAGGVKHAQLGELVLQQSQDDSVEDRTEIHKRYPSISSLGVQVLENEMKSGVDSIVCRSVGKLHGVQEWVSDVF